MELTLNNEFENQSSPKKFYAENDYDPLKSISECKEQKSSLSEPEEELESNLISLVDRIIEWQNQINKNRFQITNRKREDRKFNGHNSTLKIIPNYNI